MSAEPDYAALGREMHALATELFPLPRSLAGSAFRESLDALERVTGPIERHRFASGERVFDWTVPPEWEVRAAWIRGPDGETVVDFADSNLHLVSYSVPLDARLTLDELQPHLHSLPEQPDAIPYRTTYYERSWGFCMADSHRRALAPGTYEVHIDSELRDGHVELGELTIEGRSTDEVLLSTYLCHPSMANNELSGPMVVAQLARLLAQRDEPPRLTHRLIFVPETIGAICYLARFGERLRERLAAGYVVTCVGDPGQFTYKRSRRGDTLADRAARHVLAHGSDPYRLVDFYPARSDERQYCSPGFDLPVGSLLRAGYDTYPEYHTSLDDLELVTPGALARSLHVYHQVLETLDAAETIGVTVAFGEPQLSSRGLYSTTGALPVSDQFKQDMMFLLNFCDGSADLLAAAERSERPIAALRAAADVLIGHDLLRPEPA